MGSKQEERKIKLEGETEKRDGGTPNKRKYSKKRKRQIGNDGDQ